LGGNIVNAGIARLEQMYSMLDSKILEVRERGLAQN
jgi:hypothetical protein